MKTTQSIISSLPEYCFGVLLMDQSLIRIKAGETGYYPIKEIDGANPEDLIKVRGCTDMSTLADFLNKRINVSWHERKAMEMGSQFGWDNKASDPQIWKERFPNG